MKQTVKKIIKFTVLIVALLGVSMILTAGIGTEVKFKNVNKPFIDLDASVKDWQPGEGGNKETDIKDDGEVEVDVEEKTIEIVEIVVEIREKQIKLNDIVVIEDNFEKVFDATYKDGMKVILVDDYAEYYTYLNIKKCLEDKGIRVTEKTR